ncbi:MAG: DUF2213 domain-containing protein [Leptospiraceae bacterium]|nr:DUF2213 domain-containing protein [Leptospiraceae bacterium]
MEYRIDNATLSNVKFDNGMLTAKVNLTKAGVYPYLYSDGRLVKEAKLPEEIFSQATIDSANGAVITDNHPDINQDSGLVNSSNYSKLVKGNVFNVKQDGLFLSGLEKVFDSDLQKRILSGEQIQVSIGFEQKTDWTPGEYNGEKYDCIQRDIRINHIAHVEKGRAGEECRTILDSNKDYAIMQEATNTMNETKPTKITWRVDNKDYSIDKAIIDKAVLSTVKKDEDDPMDATTTPAADLPDAPKPIDAAMIAEDAKKLNAIMTTLQGKFGVNSIEELTALIDAQKAVIEAYQAKAAAAPRVEAAVADSMLVIRNAENFGVKADSMNPAEVRKAFISKFLPSYTKEKLDAMETNVLRITYDAACEVAKNTSAKHNEDSSGKLTLDTADKILEEAKQNFYKRGIK